QPGLGDLQQATCGERRRLLAGRARADEGTACPSPGGNRVLQDVSRQPGREPAVSHDVRPRRLDMHDRDPHRDPQGAHDGTGRESDPSNEQEVPSGVLHGRALEPEGRNPGRTALLRSRGRDETTWSLLVAEPDTTLVSPREPAAGPREDYLSNQMDINQRPGPTRCPPASRWPPGGTGREAVGAPLRGRASERPCLRP